MSPTPFLPGNEAGELLASIVESSDDAIIAKDLNATILSWNFGATRMYGYEPSEVLGRSIDVIIPPGQVNELTGILEQIRNGRRVDPYETTRRAKDGRLIEVALTVSPIRNSQSEVVGASAIARDVTARNATIRTLKDQEARLRAIVDSAIDAIIVIDAGGRIESWNAAAERFFGYRTDEILGQNVSRLMPSPYRDEHDHYMARYLETGVPRIIGIGREVTGLRRDGSVFPMHLSVGEMVIGGERKFTGILHDLTARVKAEGQLREQAALVRLGEMAAVIAHEVRNPLAAVRGAIQVIGGRLASSSQEAAVMTEIVARLDGLNELVNDLLLFARPPQPRLAPVDLSVLLTAVASLLHEGNPHREVRVEISGETPSVVVDAELVKIVFLNLFINSAQAMLGDGIIKAHVSTSDGWCEVAVSDTGPGIPPGIRDRLFTPFVTTKSRGTGLGLSTVKRLLEAQSGSVKVECPAGGGTIMTVRLPLVGRPEES